MNERISRLMDGDVDAAEMDSLWVTLKSDAAMATWSCYHTIGDALRGEPAVTRGIGMAVARQLVAEPTVLAPRGSSASRAASWACAAQARQITVPADYLLAHQEYAPANALQSVGPYLRDVAATAPPLRSAVPE